MRTIISLILAAVMASGCSVYTSYQRPEDLPTDSLYRPANGANAADTTGLGDMSWRELFTDTVLQSLIEKGLANNTDMQVALLNIDRAQAQLKAAKLAFLPSLTIAPNGSVTSTDGGKAVKAYELPLQASWEADIFGSLRNAKKATLATLLEQEAYRQAVCSELIAGIANDYYTLLALDKQIEISSQNIDLWKEQVRTIEAKMKVGEETENALTQARADLHGMEATHTDLLRQQREAENALCVLLGETSHGIERTSLDAQNLPETISTGLPVRLLSKRPDVVQAEMQLANAFYITNQTRAAFYPNLTLTGSIGWANSAGQAVTDPGAWIMSAVASLTQPVFNRGKLKANLRVAKDDEQIARLNYKQTLLEAGQEVNDALYAVGSAQKSMDSHKRQCEELERTLNTANALYRTANATYLELLTAQRSLLDAQLSVVSDRLTTLQAVVSLYKALGGGRS